MIKTGNGQEVLRLIDAARAGNESAFDELIDKYNPLIMSLVLKYLPQGSSDADFEDFRQEALIVFCNAVMRYDTAQRSVEFGLYAKICMEHVLVSQLRKLKKVIPTEPIEETLSYGDAGISFEEKETIREMWKVINETLSDYEKKVWDLYLAGESPESIAKSLGKDEKSINNALFRIRKKLRSVLGKT